MQDGTLFLGTVESIFVCFCSCFPEFEAKHDVCLHFHNLLN